MKNPNHRNAEALMLTFDQKLEILESFPELTRKNVSLGRVNFHYEESNYEKKTVAYHLHPNGNGYVYAGQLKGYATDDKGFVNIRDYEADELRILIGQSIGSLSSGTDAAAHKADKADTAYMESANGENLQEELWLGPNENMLRLFLEEDLWYVYAGDNLDSAFETYKEAVEYLREEGFSKA
jgi:hypothetical protein